MSWNDNGDSPWGQKPSNNKPRGGRRTSNGSGPQGPDLDKVFKSGQDKFNKMFNKSGNSGSGLILGTIVVAVCVWLATGFYRVDTGHQGVELVFGKIWERTEPGLHYNFPFPVGENLTPRVDQARRVNVGFIASSGFNGKTEIQRDIPEESLMLTSDQNIVDMDFTVFWRVKVAEEFLFNIRDPEQTVKAAAESAMREAVGNSRFDQAVTEGRRQIEIEAADILQQILDEYGAGIEIEQVAIQASDPPKQVVDAFNDVQRARQDRDRLRNEAEAYANQVVPAARGQAEQMIRQAEGYREGLVKEAKGEAARFISVLESYRSAPEVTRQRMYLEVIGSIMGAVNKVIIDDDSGNGVVPYLPLPEVQKRLKNDN